MHFLLLIVVLLNGEIVGTAGPGTVASERECQMAGAQFIEEHKDQVPPEAKAYIVCVDTEKVAGER